MSSNSYFLPPEILAHELDVGEEVLWSGQPDPQRIFQRKLPQTFTLLLVVMLMSLWMWTAVKPLRISWSTSQTPPPIFFLFPLLGLFFIALGIKGVVLPWNEKRRAMRIFYALTNRRALLMGAERDGEVKSVAPDQFSIERRDLPNGRGDVILKRERRRMGRNTVNVEIGFFGIYDAREVERIARELARVAP